MRLFHVSEEANIKTFKPRAVSNPNAGAKGKLVWSINERELDNYLLPRECPRICYRLIDDKKVIAVEERWLEAINKTTLYVYELPSESFEEFNKVAGYWISKTEVTPLLVKEVKNISEELERRGQSLTVLKDLYDLRDKVVNEYDHFSIIRFSNATATKML